MITGSAVPWYVQDPHGGDAVSSSHGDADIGDKSCAYPPTLSHAALPKGLEDSTLDRVLAAIDMDSPVGARDYAIGRSS